MHNQSWRCFFIVRIWVKDQFNTMLVLLIVFVWMKIKLAQAKVIQTMHPLVAIKTKSERKEIIREKTKFTPKKKKLKNNDLDSNQDKEVCRPLMTFTKVFSQLMRREEQCMGFKLHSTGKTQWKRWRRLQDPISKVLILQSKDRCQGWKGGKIDSLDDSAEET